MAKDKKTNRELRRREFLKFTALTLAAVSGGSLAACATAAPSPTAAPAKPAAPAPTAAPAAPAATAAPKPAAPAPTVAAAKPSAPIKSITMSSINNLNAAPMFVGVEKGIWVNHGLDVQLKVFTTGNEMVKAVASKDTFITTSASSNYIPALDQDLQLYAIGTGVGDPTRKMGDDHLTITARKESGIKTVADLVGKKVAYNGAGTTDEYIRAVAAKNNVPIDKITLVNVPPGNTPGALQVGQVDAAVLQEPQGTMVLETVPGAVLVQRGGGVLSYFGWMITRPEVIKDDADTLQRFLDGWAEAMQYTRQHPDEAAEISLHWIQGLDANIAKKSIRYISFDPRLSKNMMDAAEDHRKLLVEQKKIKGTLDFVKYVNTRFIEKTLATQPQYFTDLKPTELYRSP